MARLKILLFLMVLTAVGGTMAGAWWYYTRVIEHTTEVQKEIVTIQGKKVEKPDPGIGKFERAVTTLKESGLDAGREALYEMLRTFPDSRRAAEAKRILGEMNLDTLFSATLNPNRKDYAVQPGDSLGRIAGKNQTTVECLMRANGMMSGGLQPGDHLFVFPLDFEIKVSVSAKTLTLLKNGRFFKEYQALELRLPPGLKPAPPKPPDPKPGEPAPPPKATPVKPELKATKGSKKHHTPTTPALPPGELAINDKAAWVAGKRVLSTDSNFNIADKWLMTTRAGFAIRALPSAKPMPEAGVITTGTKAPSAKSTAKTSAPKTQKTKGAKGTAPTMAGTEEDDDATPSAPETGVFLAREDAEELFTIIRNGTKLHLVR